MNLHPHRIERTKNRLSRAILQDDVIVIHLARNLSAREEREHVENLLRRMQRVAEREHKRTSIDPFRPLLQGESDLTLALATGNTCRFALQSGKRTRAHPSREGWSVTVGPRTDRRILHRFLWRLLGHRERRTVDVLVREINRETLNVRISDVQLRYTTSQWGSCSAHGRISLNPALLMLPYDILHYVIIHELAHRLHRGHTKVYWRDVERVFPAFREARKRLRSHRLPSL